MIQLVLKSSVSKEVTTGEGVTLTSLGYVTTQLKIVSTITANSRIPLAQSPK